MCSVFLRGRVLYSVGCLHPLHANSSTRSCLPEQSQETLSVIFPDSQNGGSWSRPSKRWRPLPLTMIMNSKVTNGPLFLVHLPLPGHQLSRLRSDNSTSSWQRFTWRTPTTHPAISVNEKFVCVCVCVRARTLFFFAWRIGSSRNLHRWAISSRGGHRDHREGNRHSPSPARGVGLELAETQSQSVVEDPPSVAKVKRHLWRKGPSYQKAVAGG